MSMVNRHEDDNTLNVVFHEDLICEILFHLPPLHVLRFKSVSKGWYSIISNPDFLRTHSLRFHFLKPPHDDEFLFLPQDGHEKQDLLLNLLHHSVFPITASGHVLLPVVKASSTAAGSYNDLKLVDSCNGLLLYVETKHKPAAGSCCAAGHTVSVDDYDDDITLYMCNPFTKQYVKLPSIRLILSQDDNKILRTFDSYMETRIMFDPSVSPHSYKVISVIMCALKGGNEYKNPDGNLPIFVYSSETCSWRFWKSICLDDNKPSCFRCISVYLNGVMYWIGTNLVCFDVEKDRTWLQPMPPIESDVRQLRPQTWYFGVCGGRLRLVENDTSLRDGFDIMEMATEDGRWTRKYHVNLKGNHLIKAAKCIKILHMYKTGGKNKFKEADVDDDEEEEAVLMEIDKELIVSFSLKSNTFGSKKLTIPNKKRFLSFSDVYPFSITLFPL